MRTCENLLLERDGGVLVLKINRPAKLNALSRGTLAELRAVMGDVAADSTIGAVIITGAPTEKRPSFVAGADIAELAEMGMLSAREHAILGQSAFRAIEDAPVPVIAAINGFALGGGLELAM